MAMNDLYQMSEKGAHIRVDITSEMKEAASELVRLQKFVDSATSTKNMCELVDAARKLEGQESVLRDLTYMANPHLDPKKSPIIQQNGRPSAAAHIAIRSAMNDGLNALIKEAAAEMGVTAPYLLDKTISHG